MLTAVLKIRSYVKESVCRTATSWSRDWAMSAGKEEVGEMKERGNAKLKALTSRFPDTSGQQGLLGSIKASVQVRFQEGEEVVA